MAGTMAGGLFAIDRNYFYEMGEYDSGMDIWFVSLNHYLRYSFVIMTIILIIL
jgi:uncharacterized membrane protein AbrB (regulator of aidB expression)